MDESDKLAEKIGIVVQGGQVTIHTVNLSQAETAPKAAKPAELPDCPYRGLFAFHEEHVEFFFGRDVFTESLVQAVETKPLVAVVGASGSGKSSLVFAGLLPNLLEQGGWCIFKLRPGFPDSRPFHNLTSALLPLSTVPDLDPLILLNQRAKALQEGTVSLRDVVAEILRQAPKGTERVLLVVDQFEELYTLCSQEDRERFVDLLLAGVKDAPCKVVLTLRADFCGQAYAYRPLVDALQDADLKLGSMNQAELQAAIEKPAEKMGVQLEAGLTERILEDVGKEPGNLPLLEFALTRLWDKQQNRELTHAAYSDIGGVKQALADHAEAIYSKLTKPEQKQAQQIFVQLVQLGEGTADTRRLVTRAEISDDCWQLITRKGGLADCRLVVTGRNDQTKEETVEVVHEALIREWRTLRQWIDTDRKKLLQKNEIEAQAKRWSETKSKDYLLQGKRLKEAQVFQKEQTSYLSLSPLSREFIQKSLQKHRNSRLQLIGFGLVVPLGLATFLGFQIQRQIVIRGAWETVEKAKGQRDSPVRIAALQELVKL
ncbi:MAG: ATP-binding protein [Leptolyngbya sp. IPPAS B-1204]|nr:MAG: S-layer homology domain-containing protein [Leptolyngbya sp. IPPAS B-1204]